LPWQSYFLDENAFLTFGQFSLLSDQGCERGNSNRSNVVKWEGSCFQLFV
jgi:hypothetical protein